MANEHKFIRSLGDREVKKLLQGKLFQEHLLSDCKKGIVFPAIRRNRVGFYYYGRRLFVFQGGEFESNQKYAPNGPTSFADDYEQIKIRCRKHAQPEAAGLAPLYSTMSPFGKDRKYQLVDIEIAFARDPDVLPERLGEPKKNRPTRTGTDRIDFLLLKSDEAVLRFVEAKQFRSSDLRSRNGEPPIVGQIRRYQENVTRRRDVLLRTYGECVQIMNLLFSLQLREPQFVDCHVALMFYGYTADQRKQALQMRDRFSICWGIPCYCIGGTKRLRTDGQVEKLWRHTNCRKS